MSNKTQLQANNTQLASLIQTLQGKIAGGGGGGTLRVFPFGISVDFITYIGEEFGGEVAISYMCGVDEIDFSTLTWDNLKWFVSLMMGEYFMQDYFWKIAGSENVEVSYTTEVLDGADIVFCVMNIDGTEELYPIMGKYTSEWVAAQGLDMTPGIYAVHAQGAGVPVTIVHLAQ